MKLHTISKVLLYRAVWESVFDIANPVLSIGNFVGLCEELAPTIGDEDAQNAFKGDMLEVFAEMFFTVFDAHPAVGLKDYKPISISEDYGVDAIGINVNGDKCAVQVKYRSNPLMKIDYPDLAKTYWAGRDIHGLSLTNNDTIFLFTTGCGVSHGVEHVGKKKVRVINRSVIAGLVDNNLSFWEQAEDMVVKSLTMKE